MFRVSHVLQFSLNLLPFCKTCSKFLNMQTLSPFSDQVKRHLTLYSWRANSLSSAIFLLVWLDTGSLPRRVCLDRELFHLISQLRKHATYWKKKVLILHFSDRFVLSIAISKLYFRWDSPFTACLTIWCRPLAPPLRCAGLFSKRWPPSDACLALQYNHRTWLRQHKNIQLSITPRVEKDEVQKGEIMFNARM